MKISKTRTIVAMLAALLAIPVGLAVDLPDSPTGILFPPCVTVSGTVRQDNGVNGEGAPIPGITITAVPTHADPLLYASAVTAADGTYSFKVDQGSWTITVVDERGDYSPATFSRTFNCATPNHTENIELASVYAAGNSQRGTLVLTLIDDLDGNADVGLASAPMAGYEVTVYTRCIISGNNKQPIGELASGSTDADGRFIVRLPTSQAGPYCVYVAIGNIYIDSGEGSDTDGVYVRNNFATITADQTTNLEVQLVRKLRSVDFTVGDFEFPTLNVAGSSVVFSHPTYCPNGSTPSVAGRYACTGTTGANGVVRLTLPMSTEPNYAVSSAHAKHFTTTTNCGFGHSPTTSGSAGITPETQQVASCSVSLPHVSQIVQGRVVDSGGNPVAGATVEFDGLLDLEDSITATGSDGRFVVTKRSDDYSIIVTSGAQTTSVCLSVAGATPFDLGDISLTQATGLLSGRVRDANSSTLANIANALVRFTDDDGNVCHARSATSGLFSHRLPVGDYDVTVGNDALTTFNYLARTVETTIDEPSEDLNDINLTRRTGTIKVLVREDDDPDINLAGMKVSCTSATTATTKNGTTGTDGRVDLAVAFGSGYTCTAKDPAANLKDSAASAPVSVSIGTSTADQVLVMLRDFWVFDGNVTELLSRDPITAAGSGKPIPGALVRIVNINCVFAGQSSCTVQAITDANGDYLLRVKYVDPVSLQTSVRVNMIQIEVSHVDYQSLFLAGPIGADVRNPLEPGAQYELGPGSDPGQIDANQILCSAEADGNALDGHCDESGNYHPPSVPDPSNPFVGCSGATLAPTDWLLERIFDTDCDGAATPDEVVAGCNPADAAQNPGTPGSCGALPVEPPGGLDIPNNCLNPASPQFGHVDPFDVDCDGDANDQELPPGDNPIISNQYEDGFPV